MCRIINDKMVFITSGLENASGEKIIREEYTYIYFLTIYNQLQFLGEVLKAG